MGGATAVANSQLEGSTEAPSTSTPRPAPAHQQRPAHPTAGGPPQCTRAGYNTTQPPQGAARPPPLPVGPSGGLWWHVNGRNRPV